MIIDAKDKKVAMGRVDPEIARIGDRTLLAAIVSMAERETLTACKDKSEVIGALAPIQWLSQRSLGKGLTVDQAMAVDAMLQRLYSDGEPLDFLLRLVIRFLQTTNPSVAKFIDDWKVIEQGYTVQSTQPSVDGNLCVTSAAA